LSLRAPRAPFQACTLLLGLALAGCNGGIHWQGPTFNDARALARRTNKLTFVYFRSWYLVECTNFEEQVLKQPDVLAETRSMVCVVLDYDWDRPLAQRWGLKTVPAFAIVSADDEVLVRQAAPVTHDDLLRAIRYAKKRAALASQPTPPAKPPP
jgi:hypothetical protein